MPKGKLKIKLKRKPIKKKTSPSAPLRMKSYIAKTK